MQVRNWILSAILFLNTASLCEAAIVNWVVGEVGGKAITRREVQINHIIENILYPIGKARDRDKWILGDGGRVFTEEVTSVLLEKVVAQEALNFSSTLVTEGEINEGLTQVRQAVAEWSKWNELEVDASELKRMVQQKMRAKKFIRFKTDSTMVQITTAEAREYFDKNQVKFGTLPFANFEGNIKQFLSRKQLSERLRDWFEVLKRKYKVRNLEAEGLHVPSRNGG